MDSAGIVIISFHKLNTRQNKLKKCLNLFVIFQIIYHDYNQISARNYNIFQVAVQGFHHYSESFILHYLTNFFSKFKYERIIIIN